MKTLFSALLCLPIAGFAQQIISIIPQPVSIQVNAGQFAIDNNTVLHFNAANK